MTFKLKQKVFKLDDTCLSRSSPETGLEPNILNLENLSFKNVIFHNGN